MRLDKLKKKLGITNKEVVETLSDHFPMFSKVPMCMANNEDQYGVCLSKKAEKILKEKYGKK